jgi:aminopeptidase N
MMVMDGGPSQGLIVHEFAHQWVMGILGSNEWKDAYLDEGMASFLDSWFLEEVGEYNPWPNTVERVGQLEAQGIPVPVATVSEDMPGFNVYGFLAYTKPSVVYRMLREYVGSDVMRQGLRLYCERKAFQHVVEDDLRSAIEDASGKDLAWFFEQWFHTTATLDFAVTDVQQTSTADGWTTTAVVTRAGDAWMPVTVRIGSERVVLDSRETAQTVAVTTRERPKEVVVDPDVVLIDTDRSNNRVEVPR